MPLAYHSIFNLCEYPKSIISKRQKMSFKLPFGCGWLGSGCFGLRFRFGNPCGFIVLRYYYLSSFNTISIVIISFTPTTRQCRRFASLTAALRIPHAFHQLRWWLFTLLNKDTFNRVNIKPLRGSVEFTFSYHPHRLSFSQRKGRYVYHSTYYCSPSLLQLERGK